MHYSHLRPTNDRWEEFASRSNNSLGLFVSVSQVLQNSRVPKSSQKDYKYKPKINPLSSLASAHHVKEEPKSGSGAH